MSDLKDLKTGAVVCVVGRGMDAMIHRHDRVIRVTKTMLVTGNARGGFTDRFRLENGQSVPYSPYGGTVVHTACQKKGQVQR